MIRFRNNPGGTFGFLRHSSFPLARLLSVSPADQKVSFLPIPEEKPSKTLSSNIIVRNNFTALLGTLREFAEVQGNRLLSRQIDMEEDQQYSAADKYSQSMETIMKMGRGSGNKHVQKYILRWYEPLLEELTNEVRRITRGESSVDRTIYGPYLLLLPVEKLTVITIDNTINEILAVGNEPVKLIRVATAISEVVEYEVNYLRFRKKKDLLPWQKRFKAEQLNTTATKKSTNLLTKKLRGIVNADEWDPIVKVKVGTALLSFLLKTARVSDDSDQNAFQYSKIYSMALKRLYGVVSMHEEVFRAVRERNLELLFPRYLPMLVPPQPWDNKRINSGPYYVLKSPLMKTSSKLQLDALRRANCDSVLKALDYLGCTPWRINRRVYDVILAACERGEVFGEIPRRDNIPMPNKESCFRPFKDVRPMTKSQQKRAMPPDPLEAQDGSEVDPISKFVSDADIDTDGIIESAKEATSGDAENIEMDPEALVFDERYYEGMCKRVRKKNAEMHSLRCDLKLKLRIAELFLEDSFYFPANLDFRGRAYTIPPNLSHLGPDLCRGLLKFSEGKPLGRDGLDWLKVHLANLFGFNKTSRAGRIKWAEDNIDNICDSARSPLDGQRWWISAEKPFQALAACLEIEGAISSGRPEEYVCSLPVHQDGSCNGLQHYAGLGRDELGAFAVNLLPSPVPQDVYSKVLEKVMEQIEKDRSIPEDTLNEDEQSRRKYAHLVGHVVDRKVIKQTVMTSVYGVTRSGARAQVQARLEEKFHSDPSAVLTPEMEKELFFAAFYVANLTLRSLELVFERANEIMNWLGTCAKLVSTQNQAMSWVTPLGLPVMQPYRKSTLHTIQTVLQSVTLTVDDDFLPVSSGRQKSAFPPNFVHSLDASHMLMTCLHMKEHNLSFAAVHDSYWTHPCDVSKMNKLLRECFVELYEYPILEELRDSLSLRFPELIFPPIPTRGELNIRKVNESEYFFH